MPQAVLASRFGAGRSLCAVALVVVLVLSSEYNITNAPLTADAPMCALCAAFRGLAQRGCVHASGWGCGRGGCDP